MVNLLLIVSGQAWRIRTVSFLGLLELSGGYAYVPCDDNIKKEDLGIIVQQSHVSNNMKLIYK